MMNVEVYYITSTGNTLCFLREIKRGLEKNGHSCNLNDIIRKKIKKIEQDADLYGFACPTFSYREPTAMKRFLKGLEKMKNITPAFIFTSMEADSGRLYARMSKLLQEKGFKIWDYLELCAPVNYTPILTYNPGDIRSIDLKKAYQFGNSLNIEKERSPPEKTPKFLDQIKIIYASDFIIKQYTGKIRLDENKCIKCGNCAEICLEEAIQLNPFPNITRKKCSGCCACINNCPNNALNSKRTTGKFHYTCQLV